MNTFHIVARTDKGPIRSANEDHILAGRFIKNSGTIELRIESSDDFLCRHGLLFAVADGVGGETGGAFASRQALSAMDLQFYGGIRLDASHDQYCAAIEAAGTRANETILALQNANPEHSRMACTLAGVCLTPSGYLVFHAGDSRVYRMRHKVFLPLTSDDTVVQEAVNDGLMTESEASENTARHTVLNFAGMAGFHLHISAGRELRPADILLICSDGIHDLVNLDVWSETAPQPLQATELVSNLFQAAVNAGGRDNISIIAIQFGEHETLTASADEEKENQ